MNEIGEIYDWEISDPKAQEVFHDSNRDTDEQEAVEAAFAFASQQDQVTLTMPESDQFDMTMEGFVALVERVPESKLVDFSEVWGPVFAIFLVEPNNDTATRYFQDPTASATSASERVALGEYILATERLALIAAEDEPRLGPDGKVTPRWLEARKSVEVARANYHPSQALYFPIADDRRGLSARLVTGPSIFHVLVAKSGNWDKYYPPFIEGQWFVEVSFEPVITPQEVREYRDAYMFELSASADIELVTSHRLEWFDDFDSDGHQVLPRVLRPLLSGRGVPEVITLYNKAVKSGDEDVEILYLTQVLEWVAETVGQMKAYQEIRSKLISPRALAPDATFVRELRDLVAAQREFSKDRELLKNAVLRCCDAGELRLHAPPCTEALINLADSASEKEKLAALEEFALTLYATRNEIAHAKANYAVTGRECPADERTKLATCARVAAQQAIRWYASLPEEQRA